MIVVTGADGFIGSNLVNALENKYDKKVLSVDYTNNRKHRNWCSADDFIRHSSHFTDVTAVLHNGANSSTTTTKTFDVMYNNFDYAASLLLTCYRKGIKFIYASSASVYGDGPFYESSQKTPKNLYAKSKALFDDYVDIYSSQIKNIIGLRYFNVYGQNEEKKGDMASVVYKFYNQVKENNTISIFENSEKYTRDFIHVDDVVDINLFFLENYHDGIYNVGTGTTRSFLDIANIFKDRYGCEIKEIAMPRNLIGKYQTYTKSDNTRINRLYNKRYLSLEDGVNKYIDYLESQ